MWLYAQRHFLWKEMLMEEQGRKQNSFIERVSKNEENGDKLFSQLTIHCQNFSEANFNQSAFYSTSLIWILNGSRK